MISQRHHILMSFRNHIESIILLFIKKTYKNIKDNIATIMNK